MPMNIFEAIELDGPGDPDTKRRLADELGAARSELRRLVDAIESGNAPENSLGAMVVASLHMGRCWDRLEAEMQMPPAHRELTLAQQAVTLIRQRPAVLQTTTLIERDADQRKYRVGARLRVANPERFVPDGPDDEPPFRVGDVVRVLPDGGGVAGINVRRERDGFVEVVWPEEVEVVE